MMVGQDLRLYYMFLVIAVMCMGLADRSRSSELLTNHPANTGLDQPTPDVKGICESLVVTHGYPCKEYHVTTPDGYILSMQNIPGGRRKASFEGRRQPVLLQHGVLMDGMTWLLDAPEESLGYILADNGFDVWVANSRGTKWSLQHTFLAPNEPAYWDWSWDELVAFELPAIVDFVHQQTGQKLQYVGHSLGTLVALASFSEGKLVDKLKSAALLTPIAYLSHMTTAIGRIAAKSFVGELVTTWLSLPEFNPKGAAVANFLKSLCANPTINCYDLLTSFTGQNCCLNSSTVNLFLKYEPQSTSTKTMIHLSQTVRGGGVRKFDYENPWTNIRRYSQLWPPIYNMSNIPRDFPLFLSYGGYDALSDVYDVQLLLDDLKFHDVDKFTVQFVKDFAHADFVMGVTAKDIVYSAIIAFFNRHT